MSTREMGTVLALPRRNFLTAFLATFAVTALLVIAAPTPAFACGGGAGQDEGHHCPMAAQSPFALDGVETADEDLPNGARLTVTSENDDNVALIQAWATAHAEGTGCQHHGMEGVEISAVNLSNGALLTFTSDNDETVTRIQEMIRRMASGEGCGHDESAH